MVGALALLLGYALSESPTRRRIARIVPTTLIAGGLAMVVTSPYIYWTLDGLGDSDPDYWRPFTAHFAGDALNPIVPTDVTWLGHWWFEGMASNWREAKAYVGLVLIGIVIAFGVANWRRLATRVLILLIAICYVLTLGTSLHVGGEDTGVWMPWALPHGLPIFDHVISSRFWVLALLAMAIVLAMWLAEPTSRRRLRWAVAAAALVLMFPNVWSDYWDGRPTDLAFFKTDAYKRNLRKDETVLVLPYAPRGSAMLWQARTGMHFKMVEGNLGPEWPPGYRYDRDPFARLLYTAQVAGDEGLRGLRDFITRRGVTTVLVQKENGGGWALLLAGLGLKPKQSDGILVYHVPKGWNA
jgi:hypothetical protein